MMPFFEEDRPDWARDGRDWPNRAASRFVEAGGLRWHLQDFGGEGPVLLLLHGTGAATHSWRGLAPILADHFRVIAPDLPGHGFSDPLPPRKLSLPGMAEAVGSLTRALEVEPAVAAGHSAGAAVLARMCLDQTIAPRLLLALNGALKPFPGFASVLFPSMARMLFLNPVTPRFFAWTADSAAVRRLIDGTGSKLDREGLDLYKRLFARSGHVAGALGMMANWDLEALHRELPQLATHTILVVGSEDRAILPETGIAVGERLPDARVELMRGLGHLAHEEAPERVAELVIREARTCGVLAQAVTAG